MWNPRFITIAAIVLLAAATRMLPHPPNFTAVGACALFAGAHFAGLSAAMLVPLAALALSDIAMGHALHPLMLFSYGSFLLTVCLGRWLRRKGSPLRVGLATGLSTVLFFLAVNLGVWLLPGHSHAPTAAGLLAAYRAALPYALNMLAANAVYCAVLFGGFALAERQFDALRRPRLAGAGTRVEAG